MRYASSVGGNPWPYEVGVVLQMCSSNSRMWNLSVYARKLQHGRAHSHAMELPVSSRCAGLESCR